MPSHVSDIGFEIASPDRILEDARALPSGTPIISTPAGDERAWSADRGAENLPHRARAGVAGCA